MLELRPNCECCDRDLPPPSMDARICTFDCMLCCTLCCTFCCTFCAKCAEMRPSSRCPNCGGNLVARPIRPSGLLARAPASLKRVLRAEGCVEAAA